MPSTKDPRIYDVHYIDQNDTKDQNLTVQTEREKEYKQEQIYNNDLREKANAQQEEQYKYTINRIEQYKRFSNWYKSQFEEEEEDDDDDEGDNNFWRSTSNTVTIKRNTNTNENKNNNNNNKKMLWFLALGCGCFLILKSTNKKKK